jgi:uncharacterized protein (DUF1501 family)
MMNRRKFIQTSGLASTVALGSGVSLMSMPAQAQASGYKALVCVYLAGGNDSLNTMTPINDVDPKRSYSQYASVRGALALPRGAGGLLPMDGTNLGLHPRLSALQRIWQDGNLAMVHNVGPLVKPLTVDQLNYARFRDADWVPESLFSHSDQTYHWETGDTVSTSPIGWGGLAAERQDFRQVVSFGGTTRFGSGLLSKELNLPLPGTEFSLRPTTAGNHSALRNQALQQMLGQANPDNMLQAALVKSQREALSLSNRLQALLQRVPTSAGTIGAIDSAFGNLTGATSGNLSRQLYQVAKCIESSGRAQITGSRHVFYVRLEGFDHHGGQMPAHDALMQELNAGLGAFYNALKNMGLLDAVTTFTASDFGRTYRPNKSAGTDHAWGGGHFVFGGAVKGKTQYGSYPELVFGGINDADRGDPAGSLGRWLPTISVSQYATTMLKWLDPGIDANKIFPQLARFNTADIGFMKPSV